VRTVVVRARCVIVVAVALRLVALVVRIPVVTDSVVPAVTVLFVHDC
jgi:hypothetical protein